MQELLGDMFVHPRSLRFDKLLGEGAFATVHLARYETTRSPSTDCNGQKPVFAFCWLQVLVAEGQCSCTATLLIPACALPVLCLLACRCTLSKIANHRCKAAGRGPVAAKQLEPQDFFMIFQTFLTGRQLLLSGGREAFLKPPNSVATATPGGLIYARVSRLLSPDAPNRRAAGKPVAVKQLKPQVLQEPHDLKDFLMEVNVMRKLTHSASQCFARAQPLFMARMLDTEAIKIQEQSLTSPSVCLLDARTAKEKKH
eukprot:1150527-Pelagomonas_calceolata.AAC.2